MQGGQRDEGTIDRHQAHASRVVGGKDCLGCRITGALGLGAASGYVLFHQRQAKTPRDRAVLLSFSLALGAASIFRLVGHY